MKNKKTMVIRAPKDIVFNLRSKFPGVSDADLFRVTYNTSLMKVEAGLRFDKRKKRIF